MHYIDDYLLFTASLLCDWFYILWLQPCKDGLERVNKYNTIPSLKRFYVQHTSGNCILVGNLNILTKDFSMRFPTQTMKYPLVAYRTVLEKQTVAHTYLRTELSPS
jgi:hypothetical protein